MPVSAEDATNCADFPCSIGKVEGVRCADTGVLLKPEAVRKAREREIAEIRKFRTWDYVDPAESRGHKTVRCRWVDRLLPGTETVKSRFVAMEIAWDARGDTHAGTQAGMVPSHA